MPLPTSHPSLPSGMKTFIPCCHWSLQLSVGSLWPHFGGEQPTPAPDIPTVGRTRPSRGTLTPLPTARSSLPAQCRALLCMDGTAFGVMKYLQVSGFVRNDRDQSIPFQGVIFFPFMACVPC